MADTRELILARLLTVVSGLAGVTTAARNLDDIEDIALPAVVLFDGAEEAAENPVATGLAGNVVTMQPSLLVLLGGTPEEIGTTINEWRAKVLKAVLGDATLATLCRGARPAGARYVGCEVSLAAGSDSKAELTLTLAISYPFNPRAF